MQTEDILRANIQLILENIQTYKVKTIELVDEEYKNNDLQPIMEQVGDILGDLPLVQAELLVVSDDKLEMPSNITVENKKLIGETNTVIFIGANMLNRPEVSMNGYIHKIIARKLTIFNKIKTDSRLINILFLGPATSHNNSP